VAKYFGTGGTTSGDPGPELSAAADRDQLAAMWEAVFYSQGVAGYTFDQEKAYHVARQCSHGLRSELAAVTQKTLPALLRLPTWCRG
jgi:hypothetical protein